MFASFRIKALSPHSDFSSHLSEQTFFMMIGGAILLHIMVLVAIQLMPKEEVIQIPVRSLNIKFGGSGGGEGAQPQTPNIGLPNGGGTPVAVAVQPAPQITDMNAAPSAPAVKALENLIAEAPSDIPAPREMAKPKPVEKGKTGETTQARFDPFVQPKASQAQTLPSNIKPQVISEDTMRAAEQLPSEYVRGGNQGGGDNFGVKGGKIGGVGIGNVGDGSGGTGAGSGSGDAGSAEVLRRYEQIISLWIQRNKVYPASSKARGEQGQAIVRIRINREGNILFSRIDKPTAYPELNDAIVAMIRASNPVPAVPSNYPAGNLFEFLIPVSFRLE